MTPAQRLLSRLVTVIAAFGAVAVLPTAALADDTGCTITTVRPLVGAGGDGTITRSASQTISVTASDVPKATVEGQTITSTINVTTAGKLRSLRVNIPALTHAATSDLRISLLAPDGTRLLLADGRGAGANFTNTVFTAAAPSVVTGANPFTGSFAPQGDIRILDNTSVQGQWKLEILDQGTPATGSLGAWGLDLTLQQCGAHPTASFTATPNPVSPGGTVGFDAANSSGTNGATIIKHEWDLDGDGSYELNTGATKTASKTYSTPGVVPVRLKITDSTNATDEVILALPVTQAPTASFTIAPTQPLSKTDVAFNASASSDSDGTIVRYEFDLDGNGTYETDNGASPTMTKQFQTSGARQVRLRVTDNFGATGIFALAVDVQNRAPVAAFDVQNPPAVVGATSTLTAAASNDPDGNIVRYKWDLDDDGTFETDTQGTATVQYQFAASGTYTVRLQVTDNEGDVTAIDRQIVATRAPVAQAGASATTVRPNTTVTFDPAGSTDPDPDGTVVKYEWDFDGDGTVDQTTTSPTPVSHLYAAAGTFNATLIVTDDKGAKGVKVIVIAVVNKVPVATLSVSPTPAKTGAPVTFDARGSVDPDGTVVRYEFDLDGNGTYETDNGGSGELTRSYPNRVRLTARVRVTDNDGATAVAGAALAVDPPVSPTPPSKKPGGGGGGSDTVFKASLLGAPIQKLKTTLKKGLGITCQVDRKAVCSVEVVVLAKDAKRLRLASGKKAKKPVRIAKAKVTLKKSGKKSVKIKLSKKAKKALRRGKGVVLVVQGTATAPGSTKKIKLRRAVMLR